MDDRGRSEESYWRGGCSGGCLGYLLAGLLLALIPGVRRHGTISNTIALVACGVLLCAYVVWWVMHRPQRSRSAEATGPPAQWRRQYPPVAPPSPPAASGPRGFTRGEIALAIGGAASLLVGILLVNAYASDARAGEPYWYSYTIAVLLGSIVLGYALGDPEALKGMSPRRKRDFIWGLLPVLVLAGLFGLFFAGMESVININDTYLDALIFIFIAGAVFTLAFALLFRLLHARYGRQV